MTVRRMTMLETYAQHGSVSYGQLTAARLRSILLGDEPTTQERVRVRQALMEMPGVGAFELANEIGISYRDLNKRCFDLLAEELPQ